MRYPSINELTKHHESRYSVVIAVSKRARQLADEHKHDGKLTHRKPVKEAINEIADGRVVIVEHLDDV